MVQLALLLIPSISTVEAYARPFRHDDKRRSLAATPTDEHLSNPSVENTKTITSRTGFTIVVILCIFCLAYMAGFRARGFRRGKAQLAHILVYIQSVVAIGYIVSAGILGVGLSLTTDARCHAAVIICLGFYTVAKIALYVFLLERAHVARAPTMQRHTQDWIWITGILIIIFGFGALSTACYMFERHSMSSVDGECRIGIAPVASYFLFGFDFLTNLILTVVFIILLRPVLRFRCQREPDYRNDKRWMKRLLRAFSKIGGLGMHDHEDMSNSTNILSVLTAVLWRNAIGSTIISLASAVNLIVFIVDEAIQLGWVCLACCMADITCGVLVVQWLTLGSARNDKKPGSPGLRRTESSPSSIGRSSVISEAIENTIPVIPKIGFRHGPDYFSSRPERNEGLWH